MKRFLLAGFCSLFFCCNSFSQTLYDSFSDGNFIASPVWGGNTGSWAVVTNSGASTGAPGSNTLKLFAPFVVQTDYLSTQIASWFTEQEWGLWIGRDAQPYAAMNQAYVWLYANEANLLSTTVDGYRLAIGDDIGGDEIRLEYIVDGAVNTTVITSAGSIPNAITDNGFLIRITRTSLGQWTIYTSVLPTVSGTGAIATEIPNAANTPVNQGSGTHNSLAPAANGYLGVAALHTTNPDAVSTVEFDQFYFNQAPLNIVTTGTVLSPPFVLNDCNDTESGTVDFTSTGTFNAGNIYSAELSDNTGSFAAPVNIGSLSSTANAGVIAITIPAGTIGSAGYKIRVVASDPITTGTESVPFTIIQNGTGGCVSAVTDYYRSNVASGNWATAGSWQSSPDNINWITATQPPTASANTITIRNGHHITLTATTNADQVIIENGGILEHNSGVFTIEDDASDDDIEIETGGIFILSSAANPPVFGSGSPTVDVNTGAILRVSASGLTNASPANGINVSNYLYGHQSILEYTPTIPFVSSSVIYFPNVNASTIPIFRCSNTGSITVGATTSTIFNGVFESNGAGVVWTSSGNKIFRNGIIGSGNMSSNAGFTGDFVINGTTATLGGTGTINFAASPLRSIQFGPSTVTTLISDKSITGRVSIQNDSYIDVGIFHLIVTGQVSNATVTAYVRTNSTGTLTITNVAGGLGGKLFPIGRSTINPLFIQSSTTAGYTARVIEPITPAIVNPTYAVSRTWNISSNVTSPGATIYFGYTYPNDCGLNYINTGPVEIGVNVGGVWNLHQTNLTPAAFPVIPGTYAVNNTIPINTFTAGTEFPFVIANNGAVLPLDYFVVARAQKQNNTGIIRWSIHDPAVVASFEVQRSVNGNFQTLSVIQPIAGQLDYTYIDAMLETGTVLYRIKVNRLSGDIRYSNTVAIINDSKGLLITSITPNPVRDKALITLSTAKRGAVQFQIINMVGQTVKKWNVGVGDGTNNFSIDMSKLSAGVYHIHATNADSKAAFRFVKQ